jgi:hypothetical protein
MGLLHKNFTELSLYFIQGDGVFGIQIGPKLVNGARVLVLISSSPAQAAAQIILDDLKQQGVIVQSCPS